MGNAVSRRKESFALEIITSESESEKVVCSTFLLICSYESASLTPRISCGATFGIQYP